MPVPEGDAGRSSLQGMHVAMKSGFNVELTGVPPTDATKGG